MKTHTAPPDRLHPEPTFKADGNQLTFLSKKHFLCLERSPLCYTLSASVPLSLVLCLLFRRGVATESFARTSQCSTEKLGGIKGWINAFCSPSPKHLQLQRACRNCKDAHHLQWWRVTMFLAHQELQLYYFLWKWAVPVFGINWFSFVIDIFHPLSLRKARLDESNDWVLKIEDKNLTGWRGNSLKDFRGQWWLEVLALKISDRCRVCILVSDILWKHGMNWNVFLKFASGCLWP